MINKPEKRIRSGLITVTTWSNNSEHGSYNIIQLQRSYKDSRTNEWNSTTSLREKDLPKAALLLQKMYEQLSMREQEIPATT